MIRILIADDHPMIRRGVAQLLKETFPTGHFGEAASAAEVLKAIGLEQWDVLILDIGLPDRPGLEVLRELKDVRGSPAVIAYSMYPEEQFALRAIKAGAASYLTKDAAPEELARAVRSVLRGGHYISPSVAEILAVHLGEQYPRSGYELLSDREFSVLRMLASGKRLKVIASELSLSSKTVSTYRARILTKTGTHTTAELIRYAIDQKLMES